MPLIPTTDHLAVVAAGTAQEFTKIAIGSGNRAVPADITTGWAVTALLTPFNPVREIANPPGGATGNTHAVDWQDGAEGDAVGYTVNEIGLFATPAGGAEYLAFYESVGVGQVFAKTAGSVILRRLRLQATGAQLANSTFNVTLTAPQGNEDIPGVLELATQPEVDAEADDQRAFFAAQAGRVVESADHPRQQDPGPADVENHRVGFSVVAEGEHKQPDADRHGEGHQHRRERRFHSHRHHRYGAGRH